MPLNCHYVQIRSVIAIFSFFCFLFSTGCDSPLPEQPDEKSVSFEHRDGQLTILVPWSHVGAAEKLAQLYYEETGTVVHLIKVEYFDLLTSSLKDFRSPAPKCDVYQLWYANLGRLAEDGIILS